MFVAQGARRLVQQKRQQVFWNETLPQLLHEAARLGIDQQQLIHQIEKSIVK